MHLPTYIFGSYARGDHDDNSDFDVLVLSNKKSYPNEDGVLQCYPMLKNKASFSYYSTETMSDLFREGDLFAWHLYLESNHLWGEDVLDDFKKPADYKKMEGDTLPLVELFLGIKENLNVKGGSMVYEAGLIFLCVRNIGHSLSWFNPSGPNFRGDSCLGLQRFLRPPINTEELNLLRNLRISSTRGLPPKKVGKGHIIKIWDKLEPWILGIKKMVKERSI